MTDDPDIEPLHAYTGAGSPRFYLSLNPDLPDPSFAKLVIVTKRPGGPRAAPRRAAAAVRVGHRVRQLPRMRVVRLEFGPPVGFPVQFRVVGPDPAKVREIAYRVRDVVRQNPHARDAQLEWDEPSKVVRLKVDQDRARALGLTPQDVSATLQTLLTGVPVSQYREGIELIDVVARAVPEERLKLDSPAGRQPARRSGRGPAVPGGDRVGLRRKNRSCGGGTARRCSPSGRTWPTGCRRRT